MNPEELKVHERFLRRCIELSVTAIQHGNQPFGSVLVKDGEYAVVRPRIDAEALIAMDRTAPWL